MTRTSGGLSVLALLSLGVVLGVCPAGTGRGLAREDPADEPKGMLKTDPALAGSTITALLDATGGKPPATGEELWKALTKVGEFAQLPIVFSAVRLDSGLDAPRVVIAPVVKGLSEAGVTEPSLNGRLFLAANMTKRRFDDPWVVSVEFISWNTLRRKFDFGVIENMGTDEPRLRVVDGGRCFACHKNKGPILGNAPWSTSVHRNELRTLVADRLQLVEDPVTNPPKPGQRDRIDGMALTTPQGTIVDPVVRLGALLAFQRDTFRLMTRSTGGRKALEAMLVAAVQPGALDLNERQSKAALEAWGHEASYERFNTELVALARTTNTGILADYTPLHRVYAEWVAQVIRPVPPPPPGGFLTKEQAQKYETNVRIIVSSNEQVVEARLRALRRVAEYDEGRAYGRHQMPSSALPSNPKAFLPPSIKVTQKPSGTVTPVMLANVIGLTEGDRRFMADALVKAVKRVAQPKVTAAVLAKEVFTGPEFADMFKGDPLPDRDEFKDRFVAGLHAVLTTHYKQTAGFAPDRSEYASGPRRDPKAVEELEAAVVPTSACLRCHDIRATAKGRAFDPIPPLPFDPLDKKARTDWARTANPKVKADVLGRFEKRLFTDADMPPQDSPEHKFRANEAAAFDDLKQFISAEQDKPKKR